MNKILIFGGLSVFAVLLIENMVMSYSAYVLWLTSRTSVLVLVTALVGFAIGYGFKGHLMSQDKDDGEMDF